MNNYSPTRRQFILGATTLLAAASFSRFAGASENGTQSVLQGNQFNLDIGYTPVNLTGKDVIATTVNGSLPGPTLRWKEGETVSLRVKNNLAHDSSIHWHGIILPTDMDGVPGLSFDGIKPGDTYHYEFKLGQSGTYWYHSHSGFQEQTGVYGAIIIDPKEPPPFQYDREYALVLSDWSDEKPEKVYAKLKKMSDYYNFQERTVGDLIHDLKEDGLSATRAKRAMWNQARMSDRDISDISGYTYTFLMNGQVPASGWTGLFKKGERVLLRIVNAAAMTLFDVRIPGLKMTVVASDGQYIEPVTVDEFRIGVAETYDVLVEPSAEIAYTVFAQSIDRTGFARGTLTPDLSLNAPVPKMDEPIILTHGDMGMSMDGMNHGDMQGMGHSGMQAIDHTSMGNMKHARHGSHSTYGSGLAGFGTAASVIHLPSEFGPQVDMRADAPGNQLNDPGIGLRDHQEKHGRRVLTYADLYSLHPTRDRREPSREINLHLTSNMSRYMWSMNGIKFADAQPLRLKYGERVRINLVNDTMMNHPIHLHGVWSELETGDPLHIPRKHTIIVQPGAKISYLVTADARGTWAYHCHLLYHMLGMFRAVEIT
ncbi:MAG: copper resistance system multicopper oxidase [Pseudomonadales bacterium]